MLLELGSFWLSVFILCTEVLSYFYQRLLSFYSPLFCKWLISLFGRLILSLNPEAAWSSDGTWGLTFPQHVLDFTPCEVVQPRHRHARSPSPREYHLQSHARVLKMVAEGSGGSLDIRRDEGRSLSIVIDAVSSRIQRVKAERAWVLTASSLKYARESLQLSCLIPWM